MDGWTQFKLQVIGVVIIFGPSWLMAFYRWLMKRLRNRRPTPPKTTIPRLTDKPSTPAQAESVPSTQEEWDRIFSKFGGN